MGKVNQIYDVLIIGAGGAGLAAAIFSNNQGLKVAVVSKVHPLQSHTVAAQGGINAALGNVSVDNTKWHIFDTIKASDMLADQDSVRDMCEGASDAIKLLEELGVEFDRNQSGKIDQKIYGGQTTDFGQGNFAHRACYSKDKTGHTIMHKLYSKALGLGVDFYNYHFALDILIKNSNDCNAGDVKGVVCLDIENGHFKNILAKNVILATGGYSQVYDTATSAALCTGDGVGIVARAGLPLQDMEFIQFHPTALSKIGVLITEAARSAGGRLYNGNGERFMEKYAPKFKELSPRDVVSKAIFTEILEGRGAGSDKDCVLLDLTFLSQAQIKEQLPTVYENCINFLNIDPSVDLIPVKPAAHYTMGGVGTDAKCRVISGQIESEEVYIRGLYAIGEAACISVHGAGRLGCNSLLDLIVFAKIATLDIASKVLAMTGSDNAHVEGSSDKEVKIECSHSLKYLFDQIKQYKGALGQDGLGDGFDLESLLRELRRVMSFHAGVFRKENLLKQGLRQLNHIKNAYGKLDISDMVVSQDQDYKGHSSIRSSPWNIDLIKYLELGNMIISAEATLCSALWRKETRGAHIREDFKERNKEFLAHSLVYTKTWEVAKRSVRVLEEYNKLFENKIREY